MNGNMKGLSTERPVSTSHGEVPAGVSAPGAGIGGTDGLSVPPPRNLTGGGRYLIVVGGALRSTVASSSSCRSYTVDMMMSRVAFGLLA